MLIYPIPFTSNKIIYREDDYFDDECYNDDLNYSEPHLIRRYK
jgi:hypothetical protein